ncbi:cytochrome P450 [Catelliglobosispora koreensis]|uniref:cytochrome P450 n=1 Tax=Catelliglobosispora koreensis TaxID=129052 RepID=UPI00035CC38F|nr:cytochrome P450 [Catelliglobosispora koreensis]
MTFLDLQGADFQANPYGVLAELREEHWQVPCAFGIAVLRYDEVRGMLALRQLRTPGADFLALQGITEGPLADTMRGFLLNADGQAHHRVRRLVSKAFTVAWVEAFRPAVARMAEELLDELDGQDECDFVASFAEPLALRVLCRFVGIPDDVSHEVKQWTADIGLLFGLSVAEHRARIESALDNLHGYIDELLTQRRAAPRDDLLTALIAAEEDGELLTDAELRSMVITLMSAGQGTVQHQLSNGMAAFMAHPEQWRLLRTQPRLAVTAAEEIVRHSPSSILGVPRIAKEDLSFAGLDIPAGAAIMPITGSANRDPRAYGDSASALDIERTGTPHLTYGGGIHYCLGAALARVELQEAFPLLAQRWPSPQPAGPGTWLPPTEAVYGPLTLPVKRGS